MWAALRSDFKEFVSSVAEEGTTVLSALDNRLTDENRLVASASTNNDTMKYHKGEDEDNESNFNDDSINEDTSTTSESALDIFVGDDGQITYLDKKPRSKGGDDTVSGIVAQAKAEVSRLRDCEETYTDPLLLERNSETKKALDSGEKNEEELLKNEPNNEIYDNDYKDVDVECLRDVQAFFENFDIESKTDDIAKILSQHPHTVKAHFETLVPTVVTYEQFWQRYYFRCDADRVLRDWEADVERARRERQQLIDKGVRGVKNLFGGAMKAFVDVAAPGHLQPKSTYEKYQTELELQQKSTGTERVGGLFGGTRSLFVMNASLSDDEYEGSDQGDDEEELGWDEDDDEEEEEDGVEKSVATDSKDQEVDEESGEIEFSSPLADKGQNTDVSELLREQLAQANDERDQLLKSLEIQNDKLAELQVRFQEVSILPMSGDGMIAAEIDRLKMIIFEKDSELAALKASLDDTHEDANDSKADVKIAAQERDIERMTTELSKKDAEIIQLRNDLDDSISTAEQNQNESKINKALLEESQSRIAQLQSELDAAQIAAATSAVETESLQQSLAMLKQNTFIELAAVNEAQLVSEKSIATLMAQLEEMKVKCDKSDTQVKELLVELQRSRDDMGAQIVNFAQGEIAKSSSIHSSPLPAAVIAGGCATPDLSLDSMNSSGVQVAHPETTRVPARGADNEDEDDWGEAWGDEDE